MWYFVDRDELKGKHTIHSIRCRRCMDILWREYLGDYHEEGQIINYDKAVAKAVELGYEVVSCDDCSS